MRHVLLTAGLLVGPVAAIAQQPAPAPAPAPTTLSLADAIAIARDNNPAYRQALNNASPAGWAVRNAYSSLLMPRVTASGGIGYQGPGEQTFLTASFSQSIATVSSSYSLGLSYQLDGSVLSQPGLRKSEQHAVDADVAGAQTALGTTIVQQYLTVLQAIETANLTRKQLQRNEEFLRLAQARFGVGQATLIDVRQAQVARGQAEVAVLRAETAVNVEKLRLFQQMGVSAPADVQTVQLTDSFAVQSPTWQLADMLAMAAEQNPSLQALRARERAAQWGVRAATSSYGPSLSVSAGWSGFTQQFTDLERVRFSQQTALASQRTQCQENNQIRASAGLPPSPPDCNIYIWGSSYEDALQRQNSVFPFTFTRQPFQARLSVTLPIFTNFARPLQVSEARAQHANLEESVRARGLAVQTEVSQAYLTLQTAFRTIALQDTTRSAAREQLQLAVERYRVGSGTFFELLDAQVASLRAENDYVSSIYDYHKALAVLEAAVGRPLR